MASQIDICNMALSHIGVSQTIQDLNEASLAAQTCLLFYNTALDYCLREGTWPFATTWSALGLITTVPTTDFLYAYRLPSDCIQVLRIPQYGSVTGTITGNRFETAPVVFRLARDSAGTIVLTDQVGAWLQYIVRVTDPSVYPSDFLEALTLHLASLIAMPLSIQQDRRDAVKRDFKMAISLARTTMANIAVPDPAPPCEFIAVRG